MAHRVERGPRQLRGFSTAIAKHVDTLRIEADAFWSGVHDDNQCRGSQVLADRLDDLGRRLDTL